MCHQVPNELYDTQRNDDDSDDYDDGGDDGDDDGGDDDDDDLSHLRTSQRSNDTQHPNCTSPFASITSFT